MSVSEVLLLLTLLAAVVFGTIEVVFILLNYLNRK